MVAPHQHYSYFKYRTRKSGTWSTAGNAMTVTDDDVRENSIIVISHTSAYNGSWYVTVNASGGSFIINSSVVEDGSPTFFYEIF